jgi:integrase
MNKQTNFTVQFLKNLKPAPKGKRLYFYDTKVRGLGISITDKGSISFLVYRKIEGRPERIILGRFPDLSIENARKMAIQTNAEIAQGKNPNKAKFRLREEITLGELFSRYLEEYAKVHKRSWSNDLSQYNLHLSPFENRKISSILRSDVERLHRDIGQRSGPYAANRLLALLSMMFNKAIDWGWEGTNPVQGVKKFKEKSRERFLLGDELSRFFKALDEESNETLADFFRVSLLTGARRSNVQEMRWDQINFTHKIWSIPETKNGELQTVVLTDQVINILQRRQELKGSSSPWVFNSEKSRSGHIEEPKTAWKRILQRAGLEDLRIHDLRRTLGSWQAATGANSYIIGKSLGHKTQQATAIYARLNFDPVRESVERATKAMLEV